MPESVAGVRRPSASSLGELFAGAHNSVAAERAGSDGTEVAGVRRPSASSLGELFAGAHNSVAADQAGSAGALLAGGGAGVNRLTVVYDEHCELCRRCRSWLLGQPTFVELDFLAAGTDTARKLYGHTGLLAEELIVVADNGHAWVGPDAFIMCLWSTIRFRPMSFRLRGATLAPMAERFFHTLSANRPAISAVLPNSASCDDGSCSYPRGAVGHKVGL